MSEDIKDTKDSSSAEDLANRLYLIVFTEIGQMLWGYIKVGPVNLEGPDADDEMAYRIINNFLADPAPFLILFSPHRTMATQSRTNEPLMSLVPETGDNTYKGLMIAKKSIISMVPLKNSHPNVNLLKQSESKLLLPKSKIIAPGTPQFQLK